MTRPVNDDERRLGVDIAIFGQWVAVLLETGRQLRWEIEKQLFSIKAAGLVSNNFECPLYSGHSVHSVWATSYNSHDVNSNWNQGSKSRF